MHVLTYWRNLFAARMWRALIFAPGARAHALLCDGVARAAVVNVKVDGGWMDCVALYMLTNNHTNKRPHTQSFTYIYKQSGGEDDYVC